MYRSDDIQRPVASKHLHAHSLDTNASGLAESTISNGESLRLSQFPFPIPPSSVPSTPIGSASFRSSTSSSAPHSSHPAARSAPLSSIPSDAVPPPASPSYTLSPYDWHDGASGIGMDAAEERLLPTSFITSLLQETSINRPRQPMSLCSDNLSMASELTYPPVPSIYTADTGSSSHPPVVRDPNQRLRICGPPPSSFTQRQKFSDRRSADSEGSTLYSRNDAVFSKDIPGRTHSATPDSIAIPAQANYPSQKPLNDCQGTPTPLVALKRSLVTPEDGMSVHSARSLVPSLISRISANFSAHRVFPWKRSKPLPPVPLIPEISIATEREYRNMDDSKRLTELVHRADALRGLLEKSQQPDSPYSNISPNRRERLGNNGPSPPRLRSQNKRSRTCVLIPNKRRLYFFIGGFFILFLAALGAAVGLSVRRKGRSSPTCSPGLVGSACNLNSTCVCTSSKPKSCDGIAQNIVDLVPSMNELFDLSMNNSAVYRNIWLAQGSISGNNCASQALLFDVAPGLDSDKFANITRWSQATILWTLIETQDLDVVSRLGDFVRDAPWRSYVEGRSDDNEATKFVTTEAGYLYNFATRQVSRPNINFVSHSQITEQQLAKVGSSARAALDRMYTYASASSLQRAKALSNFWSDTLQKRPSDLETFVSALKASPVLLPFDVTSSSIQGYLSINSSTTFPPPLGCYPNLSPNQTHVINSLENSVFGLPMADRFSRFDTSCFLERPVYGVLDILHLRLPFVDSRTGLARQAVVLKQDVSPRMLVYSGEILSAMPNINKNDTSQQSDPRSFGTLDNFNHVILTYLTSIPDVAVAAAVVDYVLSTAKDPSAPPSNTSLLSQSIGIVPTLEVAVFGLVNSSDISLATSAFVTPSGSLFFGSDQGSAYRAWAISKANTPIYWAESSLSQQVVKDFSFTDYAFNATWAATSAALRSNINSVGVSNITDAFRNTERYSYSWYS